MTTGSVHICATPYAHRIWSYLRIMYPVGPRLAVAGMVFGGFRALFGIRTGEGFDVLTFHSIAGTLAVFLFLLILRIMDELKDIDVDRQLFKDRPLPSGLVLENDLRIALVLVIGLFLILNASMPGAFPFALGLLCYAFLMFNWFFLPAWMKPRLLATLTTHNPVVGLMFIYLAAVVTDENSVRIQGVDGQFVAAAVLQYWSVGFAWEISRKIRHPAEENAYVTYSQVFGRRKAIALSLGAQSLAFLIGAHVWMAFDLSPAFIVILAAGYAGVVWNALRHICSNAIPSSSLKMWSEIFILAVAAASIVEWALNFRGAQS